MIGVHALLLKSNLSFNFMMSLSPSKRTRELNKLSMIVNTCSFGRNQSFLLFITVNIPKIFELKFVHIP